MAIDFNNYGDPLVLRLLNPDQLLNVINTTPHLQTKKVALEAYSQFISDIKIDELAQRKSIHDIVDLIHFLYFKNKLELAQQYIDQLKEHPEFENKISPLKQLITFAIQDKKNDWLDMLATLPFNSSKQDFFGFLKLSIENENEQAFVKLLQIIVVIIRITKEISFQELIAENPIHIAANKCSSVFLSSMIEHLLAAKIAALIPLLVNARNAEDGSILHTLVCQGKTKQVEILLKTEASQGFSKYNETPFYLACVFGHVEIAQLLFDANDHIEHTMPPIPNQFNLPDMRNVFEAAKNSNNPEMLDEVIKLFLKRYTIENICDFPLHTIDYFLEYFKKNNEYISLILTADYLLERHPIENLMVLESTYIREFIQNKTQPVTSPEISSIDDLFVTVNLEAPRLPMQPPTIQPPLPCTLHAYNNTSTNTGQPLQGSLKRKCSMDALSPEGTESSNRPTLDDVNMQVEQSVQQHSSRLKRTYSMETEQESSLPRPPGIKNPAILIR